MAALGFCGPKQDFMADRGFDGGVSVKKPSYLCMFILVIGRKQLVATMTCV